MAEGPESPGDPVPTEDEDTLDLSEQQLIRALREAERERPENQGFIRRRDLQRQLGWSKDKVMDALHRLSAAGKLEAGTVPLLDITGRTTRVAGYKLRAEGEPQLEEERNGD